MESQKKNIPKFQTNPGLRPIDKVRYVLHYHHYAYRTEQTYRQWILRSISRFGGKPLPNRPGTKNAGRLTLPHYFAAHMLENGVDYPGDTETYRPCGCQERRDLHPCHDRGYPSAGLAPALSTLFDTIEVTREA
jgi:hypothetical protein